MYIVDLSHHEKACVPLLAKAKEKGLAAVIMKCTEGRDFLDPSYRAMRDSAKAAGLLFGSFHFATNSGDANPNDDDGSLGREQADWFLLNADPGSLMALDYEWSKHQNMSRRNAEAFVERVYEKTGRHPIIYTSRAFGNDVWRAEMKKPLGPNSPLAKCELWLVSYNDTHPDRHLPVDTSLVGWPWKQWSLWQYTNGKDGPSPDLVKYPRQIPVLGGVDGNKFFSDDIEVLKQWWNNVGRDVGPQCR